MKLSSEELQVIVGALNYSISQTLTGSSHDVDGGLDSEISIREKITNEIKKRQNA